MLRAGCLESAKVEAVERRGAVLYGESPKTGAHELATLAPLVPPDSCGVYAVLDERGFVKIGKADNIRKRVAQLQGGSPRPLTLLAILSYRKVLEATFHKRLRRAGWVRGEWFAPTPRVVDEIRAARGRF